MALQYGGSRFPICVHPHCVYWWSHKKKINFINKPNAAHMEIIWIISFVKCLLCINGSSTEGLLSLNFVWIEVQTLVHETICEHWLYLNCSCNTANGSPRKQLDYLLHKLSIAFCFCYRQSPYISSTFPVHWIFSNRSFIVLLFGPLVALNFYWKLCLVATTLCSRRWNSNTRKIFCSKE